MAQHAGADLSFTDPRRAVDAAETAHGVEGLVGADVGPGGSEPHVVSAREETTQDRRLNPDS